MGAIIDWLLGRDLEERSLEDMQAETAAYVGGWPMSVVDAAYGGASYQKRVPAVFRARRATIFTLGQLPLVRPDGGPLPALARRPDPTQTRQAFVREAVASLVDHGNLYWDLIPSGSADVSSLRLTDPTEWVVTWNDTRTARVYQYRQQTRRPGRDFVTIALGRGVGDLTGLGPMQHHRLRGVLAALDFSQNYFLEAGEPSGVLTHPLELTTDESTDLRTKWLEQHAPGTRTPAVLSGGLEWQTLGLSPKDSEWVATHGAGILDVAQIFGMPARILGYSQPGSSLTYGNLTDVYRSWWRETLQPEYAAPIEEEVSELAGIEVRFDPTDLLRGDVTDRWQLLLDLIAAGYDPDAAALALGLPQIPMTERDRGNVPDDAEAIPE